jgi:hypothetical protein
MRGEQWEPSSNTPTTASTVTSTNATTTHDSSSSTAPSPRPVVSSTFLPPATPRFLCTSAAVVWARDYSAEDAKRCDCAKLQAVLQVCCGTQCAHCTPPTVTLWCSLRKAPCRQYAAHHVNDICWLDACVGAACRDCVCVWTRIIIDFAGLALYVCVGGMVMLHKVICHGMS